MIATIARENAVLQQKKNATNEHLAALWVVDKLEFHRKKKNLGWNHNVLQFSFKNLELFENLHLNKNYTIIARIALW